ncbi:MAG: hypothetical protein HQL06_08830 [Nitrospirae bacterium]|nr:hypothetical protein [Nitrospirota bacterium]
MLLVQGDVFLKQVKKLPTGVKRINEAGTGYVLAEGESTGHSHQINDAVEVYEKGKTIYIHVEKPVALVHQEHRPITIDEGIYKVGIVREYNPWSEKKKRVMRVVD